jgi:hypothetical protein
MQGLGGLTKIQASRHRLEDPKRIQGQAVIGGHWLARAIW